MNDEALMRRALELAERGRYSVSPNPMVGCVFVRDGVVLAEGWHQRAGEAHAEIEALRNCGDARGATAVVTLEPCVHQGRTPPCVDALIRAGVARVVIATRDPHDVAKGGVEKLRDAGVEVIVGVLEDDARKQNEKFLHAVTAKSPFVILKAAITLDGKLATVERESQWITSEAARERSLALREEVDAIVVGGGTVRDDDPRLTRRLGWNSSIQPWTRVILDRGRVVPPAARVLTDGGKTLHITDDVPLGEMLRNLDVQSVLVEGGALVLAEFIRQNLWQKMVLFVAPMLVGGGSITSIFAGDPVRRLTDAHRLRFDRVERVGPDLMIEAYPH
jgi:diaminohydroxyphosphoribosylaminopyrimidine deaminase / 5-amino-6-(5-phosphoribosylamino)uracil reductase